jgi:hypothetical protein
MATLGRKPILVVATLIGVLVAGILVWDRSGRVTHDYWSTSVEDRAAFQRTIEALGYSAIETVNDQGAPVLRVKGMREEDSLRLFCDRLKDGPLPPSKEKIALRERYKCAP